MIHDWIPALTLQVNQSGKKFVDVSSLYLIWCRSCLPFCWEIFGFLDLELLHHEGSTLPKQQQTACNSQQKQKAWKRTGSSEFLVDPFKSLQDSWFISSKSQHPQENQGLLGFPQTVGPPDNKLLMSDDTLIS